MKMNLSLIIENQKNFFNEKLEEIFYKLGFNGDPKNEEDISKFIVDNNLELNMLTDILGHKYKIVDGDSKRTLAAFRVIIETKLEGNKVYGIIKIEDLDN